MEVGTAYVAANGDTEPPTSGQVDLAYANLHGCDPDLDIALIEVEGAVVGYVRTIVEDLEREGRECIVLARVVPEHLDAALWTAIVSGCEMHLESAGRAVAHARFRMNARHPGPGLDATGEAAWLEGVGYVATEWEASLVRADLDDIPRRTLPEGVELRDVHPEHLRPIFDAHWEAFRDEWDFREAVDADFTGFVEHPYRDTSLWKIAWAGDSVVGQVKTYINTDENEARGRLRGYTEYISTHRDWRNRGIAGALLAMSLQELHDRGLSEASLSVDTNNPGGAFQLYTSLGFELQSYVAVYTKPVS